MNDDDYPWTSLMTVRAATGVGIRPPDLVLGKKPVEAVTPETTSVRFPCGDGPVGRPLSKRNHHVRIDIGKCGA